MCKVKHKSKQKVRGLGLQHFHCFWGDFKHCCQILGIFDKEETLLWIFWPLLRKVGSIRSILQVHQSYIPGTYQVRTHYKEVQSVALYLFKPFLPSETSCIELQHYKHSNYSNFSILSNVSS